ncbi:glyoxylate/hydroxypyruvate reductase A [Halovulum dunhuangense]|uniref:Glyoxylate/hydroxypyruvate reductase A n=1 Tax=Halovulum dunhuangense TaxID=1505036 RepID=A0A849L100_9RHOB|nr:glyoxylate/hydroxypyruvate reductase A [Halovulum dunhuangense]NNU79899.1 glyoxylate/hydroxypyruvate reductase A [Halovulum dunhuangense]
MSVRVLFAGDDRDWPVYAPLLRSACAARGLEIALSDTAPDPAAVDYIVYAPSGPLKDFGPFTAAKAVLSLWAGVERIVGDPTLTQPLCRMVDSGLRQGMTEWVTGHVLRHHLGLDTHILHQDGIWRDKAVPPLAGERPVGILGLGALGAAAGQALAGLGFPVTGWSRTPKSAAQIDCRHGADGLAETLRRAQIMVLLLPLTEDTRGLLNAERLALLPEGAVVINPGRGPLIVDADLLDALDRGRIGHATLDVFATEPLPPEHPYWAHPRVTVTPHIASATRPQTAAEAIAENIARGEAGRPFLHLVDRARGY